MGQEVNISDFSDLDVKRYEELGVMQLREAVQWDIAVSRKQHLPPGPRTATFTVFAGTDVATTARTAGADLSFDTPTESQVDCTVSQWVPSPTRFDPMGSCVNLYESFLQSFVGLLGEQFDYVCAAAAQGSTDSDQYEAIGSLDSASADKMTEAYAAKAWAKLRAGKAPKFMTPAGPLYLAYIHPHVAHDLKQESSGLFEGPKNVNAGNFQQYVLGINNGFVWFETAASAMIEADGGTGAIDLYNNVFLGMDGLVGASQVIDPPKTSAFLELDVSAAGIINGLGPRSAIVRWTDDIVNMCLGYRGAPVLHFGAKILREASVYRVESTATLGANS